MSFPKEFFIGAATAAHQVEGNNIHSDYWAQERMPHSGFAEPSLDACDHYGRYEEDIRLLVEAGLNAYRFSIEWARIEPEEGQYDQDAVEHYRSVPAEAARRKTIRRARSRCTMALPLRSCVRAWSRGR